MIRSPFYWLVIVLLPAYATSATASEWTKFEIDLSGRKITVSAPNGDFPGTNRSYVDLAINEKNVLVLFGRSWIASGLFADKGGLETKLLLKKFGDRRSQPDFFEAVQFDYQQTFGKVIPSIELVNITKRTIGGKEWTCFFVTKVQLPDCVLELSTDHYLIWRRSWVANTSAKPTDAMDQLATRIEQSIELSF